MREIIFLVFIFATINACTANGIDVDPIVVKDSRISYLYGTKANRTEGKVSKQNGDFLKITGPSSIEWSIDVANTGIYEIYLCHSVKATAVESNNVVITAGNVKVTSALRPTYGVWGDGSYERILIPTPIKLNAGTQVLTLTIPETVKGNEVLSLRSLEIVPKAAKLSIEAEEKEAHRSRANSSWLNKAGYGLMFHWTSQTINSDGTKMSYQMAVSDFKLDEYVKMVASTGAAYVLFTIGHAEPYCPAPMKSWEKYHPGHTTNRDLIMEMANALNEKGIKLMCYFPTHVVAKYRKVNAKEFTGINMEIMKEFGERYGEKVAGYWFDGWYQCFEEYPDFSFKDFFKACKAGNADRIIALNSWIYPPVTEWQEYWTGETASPVGLPHDGTVERGPGKGLRYQTLLIMEPYWVQESPIIPDPRFSADELTDYISKSIANGGAVTINVGIYQDGTIGEKALRVLQEVGKRIREKY